MLLTEEFLRALNYMVCTQGQHVEDLKSNFGTSVAKA